MNTIHTFIFSLTIITEFSSNALYFSSILRVSFLHILFHNFEQFSSHILSLQLCFLIVLGIIFFYRIQPFPFNHILDTSD